ncbi:MAG: hypothetical protein RMK80_08575, partial [Pseudobdellovibrionaceae bacterium]|nr:hypothetical protein [Pseudobdellovibrionaceae bacterium]
MGLSRNLAYLFLIVATLLGHHNMPLAIEENTEEEEKFFIFRYDGVSKSKSLYDFFFLRKLDDNNFIAFFLPFFSHRVPSKNIGYYFYVRPYDFVIPGSKNKVYAL